MHSIKTDSCRDKINVIRWLSKSEDDRNVILIFLNSESTVFRLNVDTMQVIGEALITISSANNFLVSTIFTFDHDQAWAY